MVLALVACWLVFHDTALGQTIFGVAKIHEFNQTQNGFLTPDPTAPFNAYAEMPSAGKIEKPDGVSIVPTYNGSDQEYEFYVYYSTQADLDSAFADGTYAFTPTGENTIDISITGDDYPAAPYVMNGIWNSSGQLEINPAAASTMNLSPFPTYATEGAAGEVYCEIDATDGTAVFTSSQSTIAAGGSQFNPAIVIPAGSLKPGQSYNAAVSYSTYLTADGTSDPGYVLASLYGSITTFVVVGEAPSVQPPQTAVDIHGPGPAVLGSPLAFNYLASGSPTPTYQWYLNGTAIPGATDAVFYVPSASAAYAGGLLWCTATNAYGSVSSSTFAVNLVGASASTYEGRMTNLSVRAQVGTGANILTAGFVVGGSGTSGALPLLIRGSGPALGIFGLTGLLKDPVLTLENTTSTPNVVVSANQGWNGSSGIASEAAVLGAFSWGSVATPDSALYQELAPANYTASVAGAAGDTGLALVEVYDGSVSGSYTTTTPRLVNLSARVQVGTGANVIEAGFVIDGPSAETVLIRASGPALGVFGLTGLLPDPELTITSTSATPNTVVASNAGWLGASEISDAAASVGAFSWGTAPTADAAVLITLSPGNYTAEVSGASGDTGLALIELYEVR